MTVAVSVISREGAIIGAADRAITRGSLLVEPRASKIVHFNNCPVSTLWAGSLSTTAEVLNTLGGMVARRRPEEITVEQVAHTAAACVARVFGAIAETRLLIPLGHTRASLLSDSCTVNDSERQRLLDQVQGFKPDDAESVGFIFSGYDPDGFPRIYRVINLQVSDHTIDGYAAIGSGAWLAEETLHRHGYARQHTGHWRALLLAYLAKVEAEDDLYVGPKSNLFGREPKTKHWVKIPSRLVRSLDRSYRALKRGERAAFRKIADNIPKDFMRLTPAIADAVAKRRRGSRRDR